MFMEPYETRKSTSVTQGVAGSSPVQTAYNRRSSQERRRLLFLEHSVSNTFFPFAIFSGQDRFYTNLLPDIHVSFFYSKQFLIDNP